MDSEASFPCSFLQSVSWHKEHFMDLIPVTLGNAKKVSLLTEKQNRVIRSSYREIFHQVGRGLGMFRA